MWAVVRLRTFRRSMRRDNKRSPRRTQSQRQKLLERHFGSQLPFKNRFLRSLYWTLRRLQFFICFYEDEIEEDVEDLEDPFSTRPPALEELVKCTGFDRNWLKFFYRNFKLHSSNGKMSDVQWRQVVRLLFPCSADDRFADRLYKTMTKDKGTDRLLFKDLVISLWELTESGRTSKFSLEQGISTTAQFAFTLMGPDEKELVSETAFFDYVRCVFALKARKKESSSNLGLPTGSIYRTKSCEEHIGPPTPILRRYAHEKFKQLDMDGDGFITIDDIERELELHQNIVVLKTINDLKLPNGQ